LCVNRILADGHITLSSPLSISLSIIPLDKQKQPPYTFFTNRKE
jgi:hypothetical protein